VNDSPKNSGLPTRPGAAAHGFLFESKSPVVIPFALVMVALGFLFLMMMAVLGIAGAGVSMLFGGRRKTDAGRFGPPGSGGIASFPGDTPFFFRNDNNDDAIDVEAVEIIDEPQ
jgi:hypothetical protein